jgi:hypothetical protein
MPPPDAQLILTRTAYGNTYTAGLMIVGKVTLCSIELPWTLNLPGYSCVPDGVYQMIPYQSPKHGPTWCLENDELGVSATNKAGERSYVELHSGNWITDLKGCIAFGLGDRPMFNPATGKVEAAVENSVNAIAILIEALGPMSPGHTLTIRPAQGLTGTEGYVYHAS